MIDLISFSFCWLPNYIVDISQPFVSQARLESTVPVFSSKQWHLSRFAKWIFEKIIMSWLIYTARILVVTYFTMSPFFYFFYFRILTKRYGERNSKKLLFERRFSPFSRKMSDDLGHLSNYQSNRITSNKPKPGAQPTNIIVNNTAIVHMPVRLWEKTVKLIENWINKYQEFESFLRMERKSMKQFLFKEQLSKQPSLPSQLIK